MESCNPSLAVINSVSGLIPRPLPFLTLKNWEWSGDKAMLWVDPSTSWIQWPDLYCRVDMYPIFFSRFKGKKVVSSLQPTSYDRRKGSGNLGLNPLGMHWVISMCQSDGSPDTVKWLTCHRNVTLLYLLYYIRWIIQSCWPIIIRSNLCLTAKHLCSHTDQSDLGFIALPSWHTTEQEPRIWPNSPGPFPLERLDLGVRLLVSKRLLTLILSPRLFFSPSNATYYILHFHPCLVMHCKLVEYGQKYCVMV